MVQRKFTLLSIGIIVLLLLTSCTFIDKNSEIEENTSQTNYDEKVNTVNSLPLFNGNVSKLKNNNVQSLKMSKEKWLEVKQAFLKDHKTISIDDIKNLSVSDFKTIEVWEGMLNGEKFQLDLYGNNDNLFVLDSRYDEQERYYLLLEFFERPWLFYGEGVRFQQLAKGMGVSYNIVTGNFGDSYPDELFDAIIHDLNQLTQNQKLSIGDEIKVAGNNAKIIDDYGLVIE